ncbi:MAG: aromatic amino acid lyase, partial [Acidobacteriota bacterium]
MSEKLLIDGASLTIAQVVDVAYGKPGSPHVELTTEAKGRVARAAAAVHELLESGTIAYGITTGFGAFKDRVIPRDDVEVLQRNIILSHAVGVG